jgi:predicted enzyme related to lactoylglutathione lyase
MALPFGALRYLYVGSSDVPRDVAYYRDVLGGALLWWFEDFGTQVAGMRVGGGPDVLLAGHRHAPGVLPIYEVEALKDTMKTLEARGWQRKDGPFGIPDGDCCTFEDPSGNEWAIFEATRPDAMPTAYKDMQNRHAVGPDGRPRPAQKTSAQKG